MTDRAARIVERFRRLETAAPCNSMDAALDLVANTLKAVEDEMSGVAYNPDFPLDDGRMYPPREDARRDVEGRPDLRRYRSRGHNIYVSAEGALRIEEVRDRKCLLNKPGHTGRMIEI